MVHQHVLVLRDLEDLAAGNLDRVAARPDAAPLLGLARVDERAAVHAQPLRAVARAHQEVRMEALGHEERGLARVRRVQRERQLHGDRDFELELEVVRPGLARLVVRLESQRDLRRVLGILRALHGPLRVARDAVHLRAFRAVAGEPGPADGDAAVDFRPGRRLVVRMRHVEHRHVAGRAVRDRLGAEERNLRGAVLVGKHDNRRIVPRGAEHDAARRAVAPVQIVAVCVAGRGHLTSQPPRPGRGPPSRRTCSTAGSRASSTRRQRCPRRARARRGASASRAKRTGRGPRRSRPASSRDA